MGKKFLKDFFYRYRYQYIIGILILLITQIVRNQYPKLLGEAADLMISAEFTWNALLFKIFLIVLISVLGFIGAFLWRNLLMGTARHLETELRELIFRNFQQLSQSFYNRRKTGDLIAYAINDVNAVRMTFGPALALSFNGIAIIGVSITNIVQTVGYRTSLIILSPIPVVIISIVLMGAKIRERFKTVQQSFGNISDRVNENINGIRVIKAYVQEEEEVKKFQVLSKAMADANLNMTRVSSLLNPIIQVGFAVSFALFLVIAGKQAINGEITLGSFISVNGYLAMMLMPVTSIGRIINILQRGMASMQRIDEILDYPHEIIDGTGSAKEMETGSLRINDLTFRYPGTEKDVLKNIDINLPNGKSLGIIGSTGAGKTSLVNLILKTYNVPDGKILIDGKDINDYTLGVLRENIGYVPQDNFLFHDSISQNIKFFKPYISDEKMIQAAKDAYIYDSIMELPEQFETQLGERGVNLSGGQKQRISIARALAKDPKILILDDALSAVDTVTESKILKRFKEIRKNRTTLIIAHRISAVMYCDEIIVLEDNLIKERGNHNELIKKGGIYSEIFESQYKDRISEE